MKSTTSFKKLSLEKFQIAKLNQLYGIRGGMSYASNTLTSEAEGGYTESSNCDGSGTIGTLDVTDQDIDV